MDEQLARAVVAAATTAPSVHNTQPWRFVAGADRLEVWADRARALPVLDPAGRGLHLSCGAALETGAVYARSRGLAAEIVLLPDANAPDHLADLVLTAGGTVADAELAAVIDSRHTDRRPFAARPVPDADVRALRLAAEECGVSVTVVDDPDRMATVAVTLAKADEALSADPAYLEELRRWTGRSPGAADGVPSGAVAPPPTARGSSYRLRDFDVAGGAGDVATDEPPPAEHPLVLVLATAEDDPRAWLRAGRSLARLLLTAAARGLAASPMTQSVEVADTRARLTRDLGLVGHPQTILRVGYPAEGAPPPAAAGRRPVDEVLSHP